MLEAHILGDPTGLEGKSTTTSTCSLEVIQAVSRPDRAGRVHLSCPWISLGLLVCWARTRLVMSWRDPKPLARGCDVVRLRKALLRLLTELES